MKVVWLVVVLLLLPLAGLTVSDPGNPAVARLWAVEAQDQWLPVCTAFYLDHPAPRRFLLPARATLVTAGHCAGERRAVARSVLDPKSPVEWTRTLTGTETCESWGWFEVLCRHRWDVAVGTTDDLRASRVRLRLASHAPQEGEPVWVHGFGLGVENVVMARVKPPDPRFPGMLALDAVTGDVLPGNSGSPVLDGEGQVVGVVVAVLAKGPCVPVLTCEPDYRSVVATPADGVASLLR